GRLDHDSGQAEARQAASTGNVVVLVCLQLPAGRLLPGQNVADDLVDLVQIGRLDIPLQARDVRLMCLAQSEALGVALEQALVGGLRLVDHRRVRLKQDVDGSDHVRLFSAQRLRKSQQQVQQAD